MDTTFKKFNENFWKSQKDITWYDKQGVMKLDDQRVVTITIDDVGTRDDYNGYWVEIINKMNGTISKKFFQFRHYLTMKPHDNPNVEGKEFCRVWYHMGKLEWYISYPKNTKEMVDVIMNFINQMK